VTLTVWDGRAAGMELKANPTRAWSATFILDDSCGLVGDADAWTMVVHQKENDPATTTVIEPTVSVDTFANSVTFSGTSARWTTAGLPKTGAVEWNGWFRIHRDDDIAFNTVGTPIEQTEITIDEVGEILLRSASVFKGYLRNPAATAEAVDAAGWLHTGDLGEVNERGLVRIRGRKKEILKTSGGKMIAPLPIEERLKASPILSQVCIVGDGRKFLSALITLKEDTLKELGQKPGVLDQKTITQADVVGQVKGYVDALNQELAQFEQLKKFSILSREFSIADGEMTPTLKMKRNVIESRYKDIIDQMYGGA
jgi:long-subunit acyl-CoA synthetase (AMP-forming)